MVSAVLHIQHISTHEYYSNLIAQDGELLSNIIQLLINVDEVWHTIEEAKKVIEEGPQTNYELARIMAEAKTEEL